MKKKALSSTRNRHTGRINAYKKDVLAKAKRQKTFADGAIMVGARLGVNCGISMVRAN